MSNEWPMNPQSEAVPGSEQPEGAAAPEAAVRDGGEAGGTTRGFASGVEPASPPLAPDADSLASPSASDPGAEEEFFRPGEEIGELELADADPVPETQAPPLSGRARARRRGRRLVLLDTWQRSGLPAGDFADLVGISKATLFDWKKKFAESGPAGLMDKPK